MGEPSRLLPLLTWRSAICDSGLTPRTRHVALTLSIYMNEKGGSAFPGVERLARDTGIHRSTVSECLAALEANGYLVLVEEGGGRIPGGKYKANAYQAVIPETPAPGEGLVNPRPHRAKPPPQADLTPAQGGNNSSMNSPGNSSTKEEINTGVAVATRQRDPIWDALAEATGMTGDLTRSARGAFARAVADLKSVNAAPEEIAQRATAYRMIFPHAALTPCALAKHWPQCTPSVALSRPPSANEIATARYYAEEAGLL